MLATVGGEGFAFELHSWARAGAATSACTSAQPPIAVVPRATTTTGSAANRPPQAHRIQHEAVPLGSFVFARIIVLTDADVVRLAIGRQSSQRGALNRALRASTRAGTRRTVELSSATHSSGLWATFRGRRCPPGETAGAVRRRRRRRLLHSWAGLSSRSQSAKVMRVMAVSPTSWHCRNRPNQYPRQVQQTCTSRDRSKIIGTQWCGWEG